MRASGSDEKVRIAPPIIFSLEEAMEYIQEDEYVEVTPKTIRLRKILLLEHQRKRASQSVIVVNRFRVRHGMLFISHGIKSHSEL